MKRINKRLALAPLALAVGILAVPTVSSAKGACGNDFQASSACSVKSPASLKGDLATAGERDYYAFQAVRGTKLRISITNTENENCQGHYEDCGSVKTELLDSQQRKLASTATAYPGVSSLPAPERLSYTVARAGTYYVLVTGTLGAITPPPGGGQARSVPVPYTLGVKASPNVERPPASPPISCDALTGTTLLENGDLRVFTSKGYTYACARPTGKAVSLTSPGDPPESVDDLQLAGAYVAWEQDLTGALDLYVMDPRTGTSRTEQAGQAGGSSEQTVEVPEYVVNQDGVLVWVTSTKDGATPDHTYTVNEDAGNGTVALDSDTTSAPSGGIFSLGLSSDGHVAYWIDNGQYDGATIP